MLVLLEDVGGYMWLTPANACKATFTARQFVARCAAFRARRSWASNNGTHFRNRVIRLAAAALRVQHRFGEANSAWTNGTVERRMQEVLKALKATLNECGLPLSEWISVIPSVQWALKMAVWRRFGTSPFQVMLGREPGTSFAVIMENRWVLELAKLEETKFGHI